MGKNFFRKIVVNILFVIISIGMGLGVVEIYLRTIGSTYSLSARDKTSASKDGIPLNLIIMGDLYSSFIKSFKDVDKEWFLMHPPSIKDHVTVTNDFRGMVNYYKKPSMLWRLGTNYPHVYNINYLKYLYCNNSSFFDIKFPVPMAYYSDSKSMFPRFRNYPNAYYLSGLVTNSFGYRSLPPKNEPNTIRIGFLGGSTTINHPNISASYPEFIGFWLNNWAIKNRLEVQFDIFNTGRDGGNSRDFLGITQSEFEHIDPDIVVYYEGSNQFNPASILKMREGDYLGKPFLEKLDQNLNSTPSNLYVVDLLRRLFDEQADVENSLKEPQKPPYEIIWPEGLDPTNPDLKHPELPLSLRQIVDDLFEIKRICNQRSSTLVMSSFVWLVYDGLVLEKEKQRSDPKRGYYGGIYGYLNKKNWPLKYKDLRSFVDFQNKIFKKFAQTENVEFIDIANQFPQDQRLFFDAIHMTEEGIRLRAWLTFLELKNIIKKKLDNDELPGNKLNRDDVFLDNMQNLKILDLENLNCRPDKIKGEKGKPISIEKIKILSNEGELVSNEGGVTVTTPPLKFSYAASLPIDRTQFVAGKDLWIEIKARVPEESRVSFGILNQKSTKFLTSTCLGYKKHGPKGVILHIPSAIVPEIGSLMISNCQGQDGVQSKVTVKKISYYCVDP